MNRLAPLILLPLIALTGCKSTCTVVIDGGRRGDEIVYDGAKASRSGVIVNHESGAPVSAIVPKDGKLHFLQVVDSDGQVRGSRNVHTMPSDSEQVMVL